jgi:N-acetyl-anhydromuramyl-L-alanine amidase AmpD
MTLVGGVLALGQNSAGGGFLAASVTTLGATVDDDGLSPLFETGASLDEHRWTGIVIHHLGEPAGDAQYVHRLHQSYGHQGLGYHFLIGNGNGLGDGVIHVGYRWNEQLPGAHVMGAAGHEHNLHSIAICLIGNGDRRPFTDRQLRQLVLVIRALQARFDIPGSRVYLHRDLAPATSSPGRLFPFAQIREQLIN